MGFIHVFLSTSSCPLPSPGIFYHEALAALSALYWLTSHSPLPVNFCVVIFSDNANTIAMFNTLCMQPEYNSLLTTAVDLLLSHHLQLHVFHIPGVENTVTDALSHCHFDIAYAHVPLLHIDVFQPPRLTLGVVQL